MKTRKEKTGFRIPDLSRAAGPISSIVAIAVGLMIGFIILLISNPARALEGFAWIIGGGINSAKDLGNVLYYATPIIMTGLSVAFAFRTSLFNIGASGQFIVGALGAVLVGVKCTFLGSFQWVVGLLAAMVFGAVWALIPGLLKAYNNVNEVISCIMTNYIGMYLVNWIVKSTVYHQLTNRSLPVANEANIPKLGLDKLFPGSSINGGFIIAVLICIFAYILLNKTTFGFELKACGYNRFASRYAGISEKRSIIMAMVISGAMAGIGGGLLYLAGSGKYINVEDVLAPEGFTGISVALLGMSHPIGTLFAGLFIAYITVGGSYMQLAGFVPEIIDIITATVIYFAAFALIMRNLLQRFRLRKGGERT
ncbi:MAG TPA: ABC transporter permease [Thermoclostridium caenicola]|uniref:Nucleoside ABC transporter membrane protein n=1 Tax=Thermoclostridium caenicola TaxID=659425 RepID=A0A1M6EVZ2_9FIRM|nr:ABC transporter permease [Thermoclostridium caenicola]SHI89593.1 nucleoside ABC transporter membrane protein [Thermoclostridium caenicola]HOK42671.1 ABC transporter permease [Thermoclostridium caenicola]HOL83742.1 ABC transporter permease [Thermoclostridium caenicola]HOP72932.1 ABC transporter permease [Thermoclostridium caenicola]HPO75719.1 ABC transporter permease [Thermoclostridium caenicola]